MPTSSQALILLSNEGLLPIMATPRRSIAATSVPYPTCTHNINEACVDIDGTVVDNVGDVTISRQKRIKFDDLLSSLPDLLKVKSYQGSLQYDVTSKVMRWKVDDAEIPKSRMEAFVTYREDPSMAKDFYREPRVRFPSIDNSSMIQFDNDNTYRLQNRYSYDTQARKESSKKISLPSVFKATMDEETYKRLCELGFRQRKKSSTTEKQPEVLKSKSRHSGPINAWESPVSVDHHDKDFRLEDLNLKPNDQGDHHIRMSHRKYGDVNLPAGAAFQQYMAERNEFFAKYGHYTNEPLDRENSEKLLSLKLPGRSLADESNYAEFEHMRHSNDHPRAPDDVNSANNAEESPEEVTFKPAKMSLIDNVKSMANYNKWKKQKLTTLRLRKELPESQPLSVCFSLRDNAKSHAEVKALVENQVGCTVSRIQFDPVSVHALDNQAKSRWVVSFPDKESCSTFQSEGLIIGGERIEVRYLDDALKEEVEAYKLYQMVQRGEIRMPSYNASPKRKKRRNGERTT